MDNPWASPWEDAPWSTTPASLEWNQTPSEVIPGETQPQAAHPELLDSLLRHCQQVSQEICPASEVDKEDNWRSGFDGLADIAALLAQLLPADSTLPHTLQFSETATAKEMNEALKLTRHLPASASSPLSRLLASKGSLEWEKSVKAKQDIVQDTAHVGWRVLEKENRLSATEESKPRKAVGGLLSFWNRRASAIQPTPVDTSTERSRSPARSSLEGANSVTHSVPSRAASPSNGSAPPSDIVTAITPTPSAVSRFLNRFSLVKGPQHSSLALSLNDLEFLSDIVPSASDPPDDDIDDGALSVLTGVANSSPLPSKLPPPIPPPSKQPIPTTRPSSVFGPGTLDGGNAVGLAPTILRTQGTNHPPNVPVLIPPLSPKPVGPSSSTSTQSPPLSSVDVATPTIAFGRSNVSSSQQRLQPGFQLNPQPHSFSTVSSLQSAHPSLSIPPLLPPPPVSPPQTPRPNAFPPILTAGLSFTSTNTSSFHDAHDSDDEFSAFTSFPPSAPAPFPSSNSYPSQRSPSPPSPPPRRTYERTHYPSSSSTSSILSPASQSSVDQFCSTGAPISASLDSFDDFVSPSSVVRGEKSRWTPSPPPLPTKAKSQHRRPSHIDTVASRVYHAHTPSQTSVSPTVHTSLMNGSFSIPYVSHAEHQRTQGLVNHAAALGGHLWPNSPGLDAQKAVAIPPPPSSTSPRPLTGQDGFDLLGDGLEAPPSPLNLAWGVRTDPTVSSPVTGASHTPFAVAVSPRKELGSRSPLQPSPPPLSSTSTPLLVLSSTSTTPATVTNAGSLQPANPKHTGGLSAQDISFFEGL